MTLSNNNEMKELGAKICMVLIELDKELFEWYTGKTNIKVRYKEYVERIITLCRTRFGKMWWGKIENLDAYDAIENLGEDDNGRIHTSNRGEAVLLDDIKRILMGEGRE